MSSLSFIEIQWTVYHSHFQMKKSRLPSYDLLINKWQNKELQVKVLFTKLHLSHSQYITYSNIC